MAHSAGCIVQCLRGASEASGSSGRRADEPADPVAPLDVAGGLQLTHGATNRATRYPVLLDEGNLALRITGSRQGKSFSDGPVVSRSLHRFHLVRRRPGMRAALARGELPTTRRHPLAQFGRLDNPRQAEQHGSVGR
jgi:hypothetical protein